jgi:hypothetical protein
VAAAWGTAGSEVISTVLRRSRVNYRHQQHRDRDHQPDDQPIAGIAEKLKIENLAQDFHELSSRQTNFCRLGWLTQKVHNPALPSPKL